MITTGEVIIEVTAEDIAAGTPRDCGRCPIALAVIRATGANTVVVLPDRCYLYSGEHVCAIYYGNFYGVATFINNFDSIGTRALAQPFTMTEQVHTLDRVDHLWLPLAK